MSVITLELLPFLQSDAGISRLQQLAQQTITPANHLALAANLRQTLTPAQTQALLETAILRQRGAVKFSRAGEMFFTRAGLEQTSSEVVTSYRAQRYWEAGFKHIIDLCCGIGGDSLALAQFAQVTGVDLDDLRLAMAHENVKVYGGGDRFSTIQSDVTTVFAAKMPAFEALFFDPGRRDERGKRIYSLHRYQPPPLPIWEQWRNQVAGGGIKISPGVDYEEVPAAAELEFISYKGEVKEGVLWLGDLHSNVKRRATLLPDNHTITSLQSPTLRQAQGKSPISLPQKYLYEPDNAVIRAHLVEELAGQMNAGKISDKIAYLTADEPIDTPFARRFEIEAWFPFQLKRLRAYLRERGVGQVTIKKRGSALDIENLRTRLRLKGENRCVLHLTRVGEMPAVIVTDYQ